MDKVFIYWDNSNIFISAKDVAVQREGQGARARVRIDFRNLLELARAARPIERALAVGSVPPELRTVWNSLENQGIEVRLLERGSLTGGEQGVDQFLQTQMLRDGFDFNGAPGIAVLLTGDGRGFAEGAGFHADLERMRARGWRIEVLSWRHSCARRMREWATDHGVFIPLDDYYESITFLESPPRGHPLAPPRYPTPIDLAARPRA